MDDKIEGKWDQAKGKVKEEAGKLGGDKSTEIGGKIDQGKGKVKEGLGELKEELREESSLTSCVGADARCLRSGPADHGAGSPAGSGPRERGG